MNNNIRFLVAALFLSSLAPAARAEDWYVARTGANNIYAAVLGNSCGTFTGFVRTGTFPGALAINPAGSRVYVANFASAPTTGGDSVTVIDTASATPIKTITGIGSPQDVAVSTSRAYVASANRVVIIDTLSNSVIGSVTLPGTVRRLAFNATTNRVFATASSSLFVINAADNSIVASIAIAGDAGDVAVTPNGRRAFIGRDTPGPVAVVDLDTSAVVGSITVEGLPVAVAINGDGTRAFVAGNTNTGGVPRIGRLSVIDVASGNIVAAVNTGFSPFDVAVGRTWILVSNSYAPGTEIGSVTQIPISNFGAAADFVVGGIPAGIAIFERPLPPPAVADAEVTSIEVTQGIQDLAGTVPLVGGRRTTVRVGVRSRTGAALPPLTAYLYGNSLGSGYGSLAPSNPGGSIVIPASPKRHRLADSFYFDLPRHWAPANNSVRLNVELQLAGHAAPFCNPDGPRREVGFRVGTQLNMPFIRMGYPYGNRVLQATEAEQLAAESQIYRLFPLTNILRHDPVTRTHYALGRYADRSHEDCADMPADERGACAARFVNDLLGFEHIYGYVLGSIDGYALIPQITPDLHADAAKLYTRGSCCVLNFSSGASTDPVAAAHEIAHRFGRGHPTAMAGVCGHKGEDGDYPYPLTSIHPEAPYEPATGLAGFDIGDAGLGIKPSAFPPDEVYDYMGYCGITQWTSDYTYNAMYDALRAADPTFNKPAARTGVARSQAATPQVGDWLVVSGTINPAGTRPVRLRSARVPVVTNIPALVPGPYSIRLVGAGGAQLADYPLTPRPIADTDAANDLLSFIQAVTFVNGTREIQLVEAAGTRVIGSRAVSGSAPVVATVTLQGPVNATTGEISLSWSASDSDNDPLTYDILVTRDAGATFERLASEVPTTTAVVNTSSVAGGTANFRIVASDGVLTSSADSASFAIPEKPPSVHILNPGDGAVLNEGQAVILDGYATDAQDDVVPDARLEWRLAGRSIGTGRRLDLQDVAVGTYVFTLTATNGLGRTTTASVTVNINPIVADPAPTLSVGPDSVNWQVAPGDTQARTRVIDIGNVGGGTVQFDAQLADGGTWLSLSANSGVAPTTVTLTANPSGIAAGTLQRASLTVRALGLPGPDVTIPVTLAVGNTLGGGGAPPAPTVPPPTANAGADQVATEGDNVALTGTGSTVAAGQTASYQWTQTQGTAVTLFGATSPTASFTAPRPAAANEQLRFELAVSDGTGQRAVDEVVITVNARPVTNPPPPPPPPAGAPPKKGGGALEWWTLAFLLVLRATRRVVQSHSASVAARPGLGSQVRRAVSLSPAGWQRSAPAVRHRGSARNPRTAVFRPAERRPAGTLDPCACESDLSFPRS